LPGVSGGHHDGVAEADGGLMARVELLGEERRGVEAGELLGPGEPLRRMPRVVLVVDGDAADGILDAGPRRGGRV
jgi:hypothetical protein